MDRTSRLGEASKTAKPHGGRCWYCMRIDVVKELELYEEDLKAGRAYPMPITHIRKELGEHYEGLASVYSLRAHLRNHHPSLWRILCPERAD